MTPHEALRRQIECYRKMTGERRLEIALELHALVCEVAREGIRRQFPDASQRRRGRSPSAPASGGRAFMRGGKGSPHRLTPATEPVVHLTGTGSRCPSGSSVMPPAFSSPGGFARPCLPPEVGGELGRPAGTRRPVSRQDQAEARLSYRRSDNSCLSSVWAVWAQ